MIHYDLCETVLGVEELKTVNNMVELDRLKQMSIYVTYEYESALSEL